MTVEELGAVAVSVLGVWLTTRRSLWNYPFSLASVALYAHIFYGVRLYADMALQGVFALALLYGLYEWRAFRSGDGGIRVSRLTRTELIAGVTCGVAGAVALGWFIASYTDAAVPWLDASLTAASLVGSLWAARRRIENWWLWIVVDVVYVGVYIYKDLWPTAVLYAAFVALAVIGLRRWRQADALQRSQYPGAERTTAWATPPG